MPDVESREKFMASFLIMYITKPFGVHVLRPVNRLILVYNFIQFHTFVSLKSASILKEDIYKHLAAIRTVMNM